MGLRRAARECALQMLYQHDIGRLPVAEILASFWQMNEHPQKVREFADQLFQGSTARLAEIDPIIQRHIQHWKLGRLAAVDRNLLRLAVFELLPPNNTPCSVVINEALEIAKKYSTIESAQFVNGVLDSIRKTLREESP
ncbi:MAG: transcription antitermination factor NusB [Acidobacteriota bacterium]